MTHGQLRIYNGPTDESTLTVEYPTARRCITLSAGEVLPLLADAVASRRAWLGDFEDDEITLSTDLYEVLLAYQHYRRPGA